MTYFVFSNHLQTFKSCDQRNLTDPLASWSPLLDAHLQTLTSIHNLPPSDLSNLNQYSSFQLWKIWSTLKSLTFSMTLKYSWISWFNPVIFSQIIYEFNEKQVEFVKILHFFFFFHIKFAEGFCFNMRA